MSSTDGSAGPSDFCGEPLKIIKTQLIPHHPLVQQQHSQSPSPTGNTTNSNLSHPPQNSSSTIQLKTASNSFSLNPVAAKITHVKTTTLDAANAGATTIMSSGALNTTSGIKVSAGGATVTSLGGTPISLNTTGHGGAATTTAIRAIGGQSTQVRVVMPTGITPSMFKQLEGAAAGRTQITAIPTGNARTVSNTSITVTRPVTQTTYIPRATVTATPMTGVGVGITGTQRLVTPIRPALGAQATVTGSFVRGTAVSRNTNSPAGSNNTTWMTANSGQVQLIRAIPHQSRQRIITTQGIGTTGTAGTVVATTGGNSGQVTVCSQPSPGVQSTIQTVSSQGLPHSQQQPTYVATLATVLPPRQHQATLLYPTNVSAGSTTSVSTQPLSQAQTFNTSTLNTGQRIALATPISAATGTGSAPRQIRPIPLNKTFPATKLNTTSISIRAPNIPQLTPTAGGAVVSAANSPRSTTLTGTSTTIPTTNLAATRIIQLQQQPGGTTQQIIGPTGRLTGSVMLQPIIVNTSAGGKIGIRPPASMATKVQPSLTITQLGISKLPTGGTNVIGQSNVTTNIQNIATSNTGSAGGASPSLNVGSVTPTSITATNLSTTGGAIVSVSQSGQLLTTQNLVSSAGGATVVPLAITTRSGPTGTILTGTITPIKNANTITVGKVMSQAQVAAAAIDSHNMQNATVSAGSTTSIGAITSVSAKKMPAGTIYYESIPANSVQVSTGVLSLTTTTVTSSTMSQAQQLVSSSFPTHVSNSASTFTVVPSIGNTGRTIGLQIPCSNTMAGTTQIQAVPVRFSSTSAMTTAAAAAAAAEVVVSQSSGTHLVSTSVSGQQIILPSGNQTTQHMVIPLQTSIKVTSGASTSGTNTAVVSNFLRKRDAEGSPVRAAKNLGPTLLSMASAGAGAGSGAVILQTNSSVGSSPITSAVGNTSTYSMATLSNAAAISNTLNTTASNTTTLTTEALARKDRAAAAAGQQASIVTPSRSNRPDSPASSDGSTTVSANSSPGVDQQMQDGSLHHARLTAAGVDSTHFNPINDLYSNHHSSHQQQSMPGTPASSRNSSLDQQHIHGSASSSTSSSNVQRLNGIGAGPDCPPRKKSRRSTNDSQLSSHSQVSLTLPPPQSNISNNTNHNMDTAMYGNGMLSYEEALSAAASSTASLHNYNNHKNNNMPATAGNKENAKPMPVEYILRRPRNCTLLAGYKQTWKAANNHFLRYSDVKPREERPPSVIDLANQDNVLHKINGWKIFLMSTQMQDLCQNESQGYDILSSLLSEMETHTQNPDAERISDLLKGNMQRNKIIMDGINEAQNQMMKIFDHKSHVSDIIHRCASKRNFKKREKV